MARFAVGDRYRDAFAEAEALTAQIDACDKEKADLLKKIELPVEGLEFTDDAILLNGRPLEMASSAEQLRVAVPIALAEDKPLKCTVIRNGALLDFESKKLIAELTAAAGGQTIIEIVDTSEDAERKVTIEEMA
jgi:hypothetical protein